MAIDPQIISAGIGAAGGIAGSFIGKSSGRQNRTNAWNNAYLNIPLTVKGARSVGIHPLYALGASQNIQPTGFIPGQSATGSAIGEGISKVAQAWATSKKDQERSTAKYPQETAQLDLTRAMIENNHAEALLKASQRAREVQEFNIRQDEIANPPGPPNLFNQWRNNYTNEIVHLPTQESGIEMPESIGAGYWLQGKWLDKQTASPGAVSSRLSRKRHLKPYDNRERDPWLPGWLDRMRINEYYGR